MKQNSCLVYENLCLQMEVDNLNLKLEKIKLEKTKSDTNSRLKYMHDNEKIISYKKHTKIATIPNDVPEKLENYPKPSCSKEYGSPKKAESVVKLFERKSKPGIPVIKIINEKKPKSKKTRKKGEDSTKSTSSNLNPVKEVNTDVNISIDDNCKQNIANIDMAKLSLFQISDIQSTVSSDISPLRSKLSRSYSFPDILHIAKPDG